ncbi:MAG: permease [Treponema sp.]|nr:permease [Treponema sp.]
MKEVLEREFIYLWYYFSTQLSQIAGYWVFGMLLGSLVSVFGKEKIHAMFAALQKKNLGLLGIIPASLAGIASPLCMYGTIPISASFAEKGMGEGWLAAFMMSSILLNPQLLVYSAAMGKTAMTIRFTSCFLCGITAGLLVHFFFRGRNFFNFKSFGETKNNDTDANLLTRFFKNLFRNLKATGPAFLFGVALSALFQRYVPEDFMAALFGKNQGFGLLMAATVGVPLYVCGGGTIPLLISWMGNGMSLGSASAFMIAGPAMKITNLGAVKIILRLKGFVVYIAFAVLFALFTGFLIDFAV